MLGTMLSMNQTNDARFDASWQEHRVLQRNDCGGYTAHAAQLRFLMPCDQTMVCPFGLARMDNGEIVVAGTKNFGVEPPDREQAVLTFSNDEGANWTDYIVVSGCHTRPMMLTYLGNSSLAFHGTDEDGPCRLFSHDYGRTWPERIPAQPCSNGEPFHTEGNSLVDRNKDGIAVRILETGQNIGIGSWPHDPMCEFIRESHDGGRTWENESQPDAWRWEETWEDATYIRSGGEGALVRAANGWIVAALRTDMSPRYFDHPFRNDHLEGTGVSISKDDGATWSPIQQILEPGRMHANLIRLPNNDLVMTVIRRIDMCDGKLRSYRRGCDAIVSHDNGETWDMEEMYILDEFTYCEGENWVCAGGCGHLFSISMEDDSVLTAYGNYLAGGTLIRWTP